MKKIITMCIWVSMMVILGASSTTVARNVKVQPVDGSFPVGVTIDYIEYDSREIPVMIWYPAEQIKADPYLYQDKLKGAAVFNAAAERKSVPYPMIVFSHGMGGCGSQSIFYTENLASAGYVVVAMDHKDSIMCHIDREPDIDFGQIALAAVKGRGDLIKTVFALFSEDFEEMGMDFTYRPAEASALIDRSLAWNEDPGSLLYGMIDPDRIGISGHSLGGFTSLMVGGVPFHCEDTQLTEEDCSLDTAGSHREINPCCLGYGKTSDPFAARDERVKAMLPLGPALFFPDLQRAASEVEIPSMIITGGHKKMEVPWEPIWTYYQNAPAPKYVIKLNKTDHMTITDTSLAMSLVVKFVLPGFRTGFKKKAQAYKDYSVAFFDMYLKGDDHMAETLHSPSNKFVELWYED